MTFGRAGSIPVTPTRQKLGTYDDLVISPFFCGMCLGSNFEFAFLFDSLFLTHSRKSVSALLKQSDTIYRIVYRYAEQKFCQSLVTDKEARSKPQQICHRGPKRPRITKSPAKAKLRPRSFKKNVMFLAQIINFPNSDALEKDLRSL